MQQIGTICNQLHFPIIHGKLYAYWHWGGVHMAEPYLKYRTRFTSSIKNELVDPLNKLSAKTRIPKSRLLDEAIEDLLIKHARKMEQAAVTCSIE